MSTDLRKHIVGTNVIVSTRLGNLPYISLDNAASTPALSETMDTFQNFMPLYASVHRGNGYKSRLSTELYEKAHRQIADFVGANDLDHVVILGKNTTEAINKLSYRLGLRKHDVVLISHLEHHSNDLPWRAQATVKRIKMTADGDIDTLDYELLLAKYSKRIKLVAITGASNVTGSLPDVHWFARKAHEAGAQIFVDCAQLAAHKPIKMGKLTDEDHLDYIALSGHKMYAPFGTGALVGRRDTFMRGEPEYRGGGTVNFVSSTLVDWASPPDGDEAGSPNVLGAITLGVACQTLEAIGMPAIAKHEAELANYAIEKMQTVPGLTLFGHKQPFASRLGVIPFSLAGVHPQLVAAILGYEWGIGVRAGCFCAQSYVMSLLGLSRTDQHIIRHNILHLRRDQVPGLVRVSIGMYNTTEEIDRLVQALQAISMGDHGRYQVDTASGQYTPTEARHADQQALAADDVLAR